MKKTGVVVPEAVTSKTNSELYTFFGRAALDRKPALLALGLTGGRFFLNYFEIPLIIKILKSYRTCEAESPAWVSALAMELRKADPKADTKMDNPEAKTKVILSQLQNQTDDIRLIAH